MEPEGLEDLEVDPNDADFSRSIWTRSERIRKTFEGHPLVRGEIEGLFIESEARDRAMTFPVVLKTMESELGPSIFNQLIGTNNFGQVVDRWVEDHRNQESEKIIDEILAKHQQLVGPDGRKPTRAEAAAYLFVITQGIGE